MQITRYDETLVDARAVNLTNSIGTVDIDVPVGFSCPTGAFRLSEPNNVTFTHFIADVPSYGGERVFIITSLTAINSKVTEYYYTLDYLKDYAYRNHSKYIDGYINMPNTLVTSVYQQDDHDLIHNSSPVNQHVTSLAENITMLYGNLVNESRPFILLNLARDIAHTTSTPRAAVQGYTNGAYKALACKTLYVLDSADLMDDFNKELMKLHWITDPSDPDKQIPDPAIPEGTLNSLYCNISKVFYAPVILDPAASDAEWTTKPKVTTITATTPNTERGITYIDNNGKLNFWELQTTAEWDDKLLGHIAYINLPVGIQGFSGADGGVIIDTRSTGIFIDLVNANDLPPYKRYNFYVPYIGWYELPLSEMVRLQDLTSLSVTRAEVIIEYHFDLLNAVVACRFGLKFGTGQTAYTQMSTYMTPYTPLPMAPAMTSNYAASAIAENHLYESNQQTNAISSIVSMGTGVLGGLMSGNPMNAASSLINGIGNTFVRDIQLQAQHEQAQLTNNLGTFTSGRDSSEGQVDRKFKLKIVEYHCQLTYSEATKLYGFPTNQYQDTLYLARTPEETENVKYWINTSSSYIPGPPDYANNVKAVYSQDYITYIGSI